VENQSSAGMDVRRYLTVVRRHIVLIVVLMLALGGAAYAYSASKTPIYESTAQLLYVPQLNIQDPLSQSYTDPTTQELQMQSAVTLITGPQISQRVGTSIGGSSAVPNYSVSAAITTSDANSTSPVDNGVAVTVDSTDPRWSAKLANTYAKAFTTYSMQVDQASIAAAQKAITAKLKGFTPAERTTEDYLLLTQSLNSLEILSSTTTGDFEVAVPAGVSSTPVSPKPKRSAAIGIVLGLILGIGLGFLREKLDTRLHDHREVSEIVHLPVIGRVAKIPEQALAKGSLIVMSDTDARAAESIRVVRTNLQFASLGEAHQVIMVMSAQKGEGKSLLTANLTASLALAGKKVLLIDADLRRPRVHSIFGVRNTLGLSSVIAGFCSLDDALQTRDLDAPKVVTVRGNGDGPQTPASDTLPPLTLLTSGPIPPNPGEMVASRRLATIIRELAARGFDYVFIDSPAFLAVGDAAALAAVADAIFLLVNLKLTNRPTLEEARDFLEPLPPAKLGVVTVMDDAGKGERYHYYQQNA
jgi:Mrp family chromosome partitioning ATPase/capsular polysaccharide biosynthesis protein